MTTHSTEYRAICEMVAERLGPAAHDVERAIRPGGVVFRVPDESGARWTCALEIRGRRVRQPITVDGGGMAGERFTGRGWHRRIAEDVAGRLAAILAAGRSADFVPTIEQVAEALGEPFAHLAPFPTHHQPGGPGSDLVPVLWWAVYRWSGGAWLVTVYAGDGNLAALAGPTRADALRAAWAYITSRQEPSP